MMQDIEASEAHVHIVHDAVTFQQSSLASTQRGRGRGRGVHGAAKGDEGATGCNLYYPEASCKKDSHVSPSNESTRVPATDVNRCKKFTSASRSIFKKQNGSRRGLRARPFRWSPHSGRDFAKLLRFSCTGLYPQTFQPGKGPTRAPAGYWAM